MKSYKLPNAAASTLTISTTALTLKEAILSAGSSDFDYNTFAYMPTGCDLFIESESIRWLDDGNTPTSAAGHLASASGVAQVSLRDIDITNLKLIRAGASDATVTVRIGNPDRY